VPASSAVVIVNSTYSKDYFNSKTYIMKQVLLPFGAFVAILFAACQKEADVKLKDVENQPVSQKILGKWLLHQKIEQCFETSGKLVSEDIEAGNAGDSVVFKKDSIVYSYSDIDDDHRDRYKIVNEQAIQMGTTTWKIDKLTATELILTSQEKDLLFNTNTLVRLTLKRN
jgi:hypothetical protein